MAQSDRPAETYFQPIGRIFQPEGEAGMIAWLRSKGRAAIGSLIEMLPTAVRSTVLEALLRSESDYYPILTRLAAKYNVVGFRVSGEYGAIQSQASDSVILKNYATKGHWARETNRTLMDFFAGSSGGTYLDIGANIGLTTIPVSHNSKIQCFAFEPDPDNFSNLTANIRENCFNNNVRLFNLALSEEDGELLLERAEGNLGDHRLRLGRSEGTMGEQSRQTIPVQSRRLDSLGLECSHPLAVKIDTQGAEAHVIAGGMQLLAGADLLIVEFWPYAMNRLGSDCSIVLDFLRQFPDISIHDVQGVNRSEAAGLSAGSPAVVLDRLHDLARSNINNQRFFCDILAKGQPRQESVQIAGRN
jgi:FkbM family methyltransferase